MTQYMTKAADITVGMYSMYYEHLLKHKKFDEAFELFAETLANGFDSEIDAVHSIIAAKLHGACACVAPNEFLAEAMANSTRHKIMEVRNKCSDISRNPMFDIACTRLDSGLNDRESTDISYCFPMITFAYSELSGRKLFRLIPRKKWIMSTALNTAADCFYRTVSARKNYSSLLDDFMVESGFELNEGCEPGEEEVVS